MLRFSDIKVIAVKISPIILLLFQKAELKTKFIPGKKYEVFIAVVIFLNMLFFFLLKSHKDKRKRNENWKKMKTPKA